MTVYTKATGTSSDYIDLITKLRDFLLANGFLLEFYSDNIITGTNLGKRLHMSKNSVYYNFAISNNNSTTGNSVSYSSNSISELGCNCSLSFNSGISWFSNNPEPDIPRAEYKSSASYWFYVNDKNIIIVLKYAPNKYTMVSLGEANSYTSAKIVYQTGTSTTSLTGSRLTGIPLFKRNKTGYFIDSTYYRESSGNTHVNHYNDTTSQIPFFSVSTNGFDRGFVNRSDNAFNGTSIIMPFIYYTRLDSPISTSKYYPTFTIDNLFAINFKNHTAEAEMELGTNKYDVFPFLQKESPQIYSSTENFGMGIAIKTAE